MSRVFRALEPVLVAALVLLLLASSDAVAQGVGSPDRVASPLVIPKIDGPVVLDGRVQDAAWEHAVVLSPVMTEPDFGAEPSERTEFLLAHDGEYLYFGCRAYDTDPDGIRAPSLRRNDGRWINDWCVINLDPLYDRETSLVFGTNPAGIRTDVYFANDATEGGNFDWNTFWDNAAVQTDQGWFAEMRIPFSSIPFQVEDGKAVMGVTVWRNIARKNERVTYPPIPPRWGQMSLLKASQMQTVVLEGVDARRALHITPYALAGRGHTHALDAEGIGYDRSVEQTQEMGLDVHYGLGPNFTVDVSLNTDFAQVEADDQEVNLTRFSLFFPEKRRFFQERSAVFAFSLGGNERLFHSRRVGLAEGQPARIYGGARVVGRPGDWDVGVLNMQTAESELLPSENKGVVRLRRRVLNEHSYAGGILTSRLGADGSRNLVYGGDALLRLFGQDYLTLNWAQSFDDAEEAMTGGPVGLLDRSLARLQWQRRGTDGLTYLFELSRAGAAFEPGLGFLIRRDFTKADAGLGYGWRPGAGSPLLRYGIELDASIFRRNVDNTIETVTLEPEVLLETRGGHQVTASLAHHYEDLERGFQLSEAASIPDGTYRYWEGSLRYRPPLGGIFRPTVQMGGGQFFDGRRRSLGFSPEWAPSRHLSLEAAYSIDRITFSERDESFTAHLARLRAEVMLSTKVSAVTLVQYNSAIDRVVTNFRFRYHAREGNDLWIVWNEGVNTNRFRDEPALPWSDARSVMLKYTHTFSLGL